MLRNSEPSAMLVVADPPPDARCLGADTLPSPTDGIAGPDAVSALGLRSSTASTRTPLGAVEGSGRPRLRFVVRSVQVLATASERLPCVSMAGEPLDGATSPATLLEPGADEGVDDVALEENVDEEDWDTSESAGGHDGSPVVAFGAEEAADSNLDERV